LLVAMVVDIRWHVAKIKRYGFAPHILRPGRKAWKAVAAVLQLFGSKTLNHSGVATLGRASFI